ncbi:MAG: S-adenosylmethionine decarboxylase [Acidobacteria bacterium]|nr:S-adenosylmethionine decarboxylase [Acidobacteriota bacterium]
MIIDQKVISSKYARMAPKSRIAAEARGFSGVSRTAYEATCAWGISTAVDVYGCDPDAIRSRERIAQFTRELCDLLGVKRFGETQIVRFGDDPRVYGYSMVQLIETSLVSAHFSEDSNTVYLDLFSCKWYDAEAAAEYAKDFFRAERIRMQTCLRD